MSIRGIFAALILPVAASAEQPLSVIDWLGQNPPDVAGHVLLEPPVSKTALQPDIQVSPLEAAPVAVGLVPSDVTGLPPDLWSGSDADTLVRLIRTVPVRDSPAMQTLLYTLLLSESVPPEGAGTAEKLLLARIDRLLALGATDPAQALAEQGNPAQSIPLFRRWFDAALLTGDEDRGCAVLSQAPHLAPDYAARIFCNVRLGDWETAALLLESAHALELLPPDRLALLDRFLSPDVFEDARPLPVPDSPNPLDFRLFESIGERLPTASLPTAFATADLRDVAGWKAQLEAAERLTRVGALSPNHLLGLYTERRPSASGGIWDRVRAVQQFETALNSKSAEAIAKTLPPVWSAMQQAQLQVPFAALFGDSLTAADQTLPAIRDLAWRIGLLSPDFRQAASSAPSDTADHRFLAALAGGDPAGFSGAANTTMRAIADAFAAPPGARPKPLGEALLMAMHDYHDGAAGNPEDLTRALSGFRSAGLDDTARRAALELTLLGTP